jgi:hypothetical protein
MEHCRAIKIVWRSAQRLLHPLAAQQVHLAACTVGTLEQNHLAPNFQSLFIYVRFQCIGYRLGLSHNKTYWTIPNAAVNQVPDCLMLSLVHFSPGQTLPLGRSPRWPGRPLWWAGHWQHLTNSKLSILSYLIHQERACLAQDHGNLLNISWYSWW